jgi:uncharacterized membrane protein YfcA
VGGVRIRWFLGWLALVYAAWLAYVASAGAWPTLASHWPIALAMVAGSYVAGSTPMGGGTVAFPILVLLLGESARLGRDFAFAIQALGMTSAAIYIACAGRPLAARVLRSAMLGVLVGMPPAVALVAPRVDEVSARMLFAVVWAAFGLLHLARLPEVCAATGITRTPAGFDRAVGFAAGFLGSLVASVIGVGVDLLVYAALVLLARADLRIAIPTAVVGMAFASAVGLASQALLSRVAPADYAFAPGLFDHWLAAAPIVVVGAPFGAFVVARIGRRPTLLLVSVLCAAQFGFMAWHERRALGAAGLAASLAAIALAGAAFGGLYVAGSRLAVRRGRTDIV